MSTIPIISRRTLLKRVVVSAVALPFCRSTSALAAGEASRSPSLATGRVGKLKLGVASISLRELSVDAAIAVLKQLEIGFVSIHGVHASFEKDSPEKCAAVAKAFRDAGIAVSTSSVVNLPNREDAVRHAFANALAAGLTQMTCKPALDAFPLIERFVKETGLRLAVHNHGPEDTDYPSPYEVLKAIAPYDSRIGLCLDIGHAMRAGADSIKVIQEAAGRLYDVHLKDSLAQPGAKRDVPVEVGRGNLDIPGILTALLKIKYAGVAAFEYERVGVNPVTGLAESVGYVRGVLAGLPAT